jgi:hypothetical protein
MSTDNEKRCDMSIGEVASIVTGLAALAGLWFAGLEVRESGDSESPKAPSGQRTRRSIERASLGQSA